MKWKKRREAAVLAAAVLLCGGMYSVQAENHFSAGQTTLEKGEYLGLAVDNKETVVNVVEGSTISGQNGDLNTEGGTINMEGTAVTGTGLWANEQVPAEGDPSGGTITMNGGSVNGGDVYAQGNSTITLDGTKTDVRIVGMTQTVKVNNDGKEVTTTGTSAGKVIFTGGAQATADSIEANGKDGKLTVSGDETSVTAGWLTMQPMGGYADGSDVEVSGGKLTVKNEASMTGGALTVSGGTVDLGSAILDNNNVTVSGGALTVNGAANMTGSTMTVTGGSVHFAKDWTAAGGSTTVGTAGDAAATAEGDTLTVDGTAKLSDHDLTVESGKTVSQGALEAANGTEVTVNGTLNVTGNASLDGSTLTSNGTTTAGSLTAKNQSEITANGTLKVNGAASLTHSTLTSDGKTELGSLSAEDRSDVTVNAGKTLNVAGNVVLSDSSDLITHGTTTIEKDLTAGKTSQVTVDGTLNITGNAALSDASNVTVNAGKELTVGGEMSLTNNKMESWGTTTLGSLTSQNSDILVGDGTFTVNGAVNTDHFKVVNGTVNFNKGGTMTGDVGTKEDGSDGKSALYINGSGTVNATDVTFTGGEVAVDDGGTLNLTDGTVDVPTGYFTTEGGTITTDGTTIKSGIGANGEKGTATLTNSTLTGGYIGVQDNGAITMNGGTADVDNVWLETGTITFDQKAQVTADAITANGTDNTLAILNGSAVVAGSLTVADGDLSITGNLTVEETDLLNDAETATPGSLTITGTTTLSNGKTLTVDQGVDTNFAGTVNVNDTASIAVNGSATFASGSKLYADSTEPAVTVSGGANLTFASGSSVYTTASENAGTDGKYAVNTVAKAEGTGSIAVEDNASLFVQNLDKDKTYSLADVITGTGTGETTGWTGKVYGKNKLQTIDKTTGEVKNQSVSEAYKGAGILAAGVYDAAILASTDKATAASDFIENVTTNRGEEKADDARIANALNSHTGMTGLAGAGYGTYRFTTAFTDAAANHEEGDLWASYLHDKSSVDGLSVGSLSADYDLTFDGAIVGSDFYRKGNTTIGAAFAYADGDISTKSGVSTENDVDYYGGMIYGSVKGAAGMTYRAEIGYNRSSNDITQTNTGTVITGSVDADAFHVGVSAEKEILSSAGTWTPFVGLQYIDLSMDDYSDSLGFRHEGDSAGIWNMPLGVNYKYEMERGGWTYAPAVTVGYRFTFGDDSLNETLRYNGTGSTFGTEIAEDSFFTRIGLTAKKDNLGFGVHYGYERGSNTEANQWGIDCSFYF